MRTPSNRAARRQMRASANIAAPLLARTCYDRNPRNGRTVLVTHPCAVTALERIFNLVLTEGGAVQIMRLTEATARAFPAFDPAIIPPDAKPWIAAGLDVDGRASFSIRHIAVNTLTGATTERRMAEAVMRAALAPSLARSGWEGQEARA